MSTVERQAIHTNKVATSQDAHMFALITSTRRYAKHVDRRYIIATAIDGETTSLAAVDPHLIQRTIRCSVHMSRQTYLYADKPLLAAAGSEGYGICIRVRYMPCNPHRRKCFRFCPRQRHHIDTVYVYSTAEMRYHCSIHDYIYPQ